MKASLALFIVLLSMTPIMSTVSIGGENLSEELKELIPSI